MTVARRTDQPRKESRELLGGHRISNAPKHLAELIAVIREP